MHNFHSEQCNGMHIGRQKTERQIDGVTERNTKDRQFDMQINRPTVIKTNFEMVYWQYLEQWLEKKCINIDQVWLVWDPLKST